MSTTRPAASSLRDRAASLGRVLIDVTGTLGVPLSGDLRMASPAAARLMGLSADRLDELAAEGIGPRRHHLGVAGSRTSVRVADLAAWGAAQQLAGSWRTGCQMLDALMPVASREDRTEATAELLRRAAAAWAESAGIAPPAGLDRVSEPLAAELLGVGAAHLRNLRSRQDGPEPIRGWRSGVRGGQVGYTLLDLARYVEGRMIFSGEE